MANNVDPKLRNICVKIAGVAYRRGMPLYEIVRIMWDEYDRMFGWDLLTPEAKEALIKDLTTPRPTALLVLPSPAKST
jgi:hypothetical protein